MCMYGYDLLFAPLVYNTSAECNQIRRDQVGLAKDLYALIQLVCCRVRGLETGRLGSSTIPGVGCFK